MYFLIENDDLLEKCNNIWDKVNTTLRRIWYQASPQESVSEKSKKISWWWSYKFLREKKFLKMESNHTYLEVIDLNCALNKDWNYYPQGFLKRV